MTEPTPSRATLIDQLADVIADAVCQNGIPTRDIAAQALAWLAERRMLAFPVEAKTAERADVEMVSMPAAEYDQLRVERDQLRALVAAVDEYGDRHVIDLREDGWTIAHPLSCRAKGLFACDINIAAQSLDHSPMIGRYEVTAERGSTLIIGDPMKATSP